MATRRTKSEDEKIDAASLEKVIKLLEPSEVGVKPITKKDACSMLCIAYNTTRLGTLIEKYKEKKLKEAERRSALRGKPATADEVLYIISEYLEGRTMESISAASYRGNTFIKRILEENSVPIRASSTDYFNPPLIPEGAMRDIFRVGETVYSARYDSICTIEGIYKGAYRIYLLADKWRQYAYQEACELASLEHLRTLGVKV